MFPTTTAVTLSHKASVKVNETPCHRSCWARPPSSFDFRQLRFFNSSSSMHECLPPMSLSLLSVCILLSAFHFRRMEWVNIRHPAGRLCWQLLGNGSLVGLGVRRKKDPHEKKDDTHHGEEEPRESFGFRTPFAPFQVHLQLVFVHKTEKTQ